MQLKACNNFGITMKMERFSLEIFIKYFKEYS